MLAFDVGCDMLRVGVPSDKTTHRKNFYRENCIMRLRSTTAGIFAAGIFCLLSAPLDAATVSSLIDNFTANTVDAAKWNTQAADFEVGSGTSLL